MAEAPAQVLQQALRDPDRAWSDWRRGGKGRPRWKKKGRAEESFRFPRGDLVEVRRIGRRRWAEAKLPNPGSCRFRRTRPHGGAAKYATVSRSRGRWYVSSCAERLPPAAEEQEERDRVRAVVAALAPVGVDRGAAVPPATSTETTTTTKERARCTRTSS